MEEQNWPELGVRPKGVSAQKGCLLRRGVCSEGVFAINDSTVVLCTIGCTTLTKIFKTTLVCIFATLEAVHASVTKIVNLFL